MIVDILKNAPCNRTIYIWSDTFGKLEVCKPDLESSFPILLKDHNLNYRSFSDEGIFDECPDSGRCSIWPSEQIRDWNKWQIALLKEGDLVRSKNSGHIFVISKFCQGRVELLRIVDLERREFHPTALDYMDLEWIGKEKEIEIRNAIERAPDLELTDHGLIIKKDEEEELYPEEYNDPSNSVFTESYDKKCELDMVDSNGYVKNCPYGASISFPREPLKRIHVGSGDCMRCACYRGKLNDRTIICSYHKG